MRFEPYARSAALPNIIVDGPRNEGTVLALSHWAKSGTPPELAADTSTGIVFRYLDTPRAHVNADAVSNNHFDEDGLLGIHALLDPASAERHRDLLIDASRAGDFEVYQARDAARIAFALGAFSDPDRSPLPAAIFAMPFPDQTAALYVHALEILPTLLAEPARYQKYWEDEDRMLTEHETLFERGVITIEEQPALDLAVVRAPENIGRPHRYAVHSRTERTRIAIIQGPHIEFYYRYEGWVQMASRRPLLRVDLTRLAEELNREQGGAGHWVAGDAAAIVPRVRLEGGSPRLSPDEVLTRLEHHLGTAPVAWDPYL